MSPSIETQGQRETGNEPMTNMCAGISCSDGMNACVERFIMHAGWWSINSFHVVGHIREAKG